MGYERHHAVIVSSWREKEIERVHKKANTIFKNQKTVSEIIMSPINSVYTFFIAPDGSKEGWKDSQLGDIARDKFIDWLIKNQKRLVTDWAEIQYGDDDHINFMTRNSGNQERRLK